MKNDYKSANCLILLVAMKDEIEKQRQVNIIKKEVLYGKDTCN